MVADSGASLFGQGRRLASRISPFTAIATLVCAVLAILAVYPLGAVVIRLFWVDGQFNLAAIQKVIALPGIGELLSNTIIMVAASSLVSLVVGAMLAWANERTDARMGLVTDLLPFIPFLLPPVAGAIGWVLLLSPRAGFANAVIRGGLDMAGIHMTRGPFDIYSWYGLILVVSMYQVPYVFLLLSAGLRNFDASLEEQARISGAGTLRILRRITFPALTPALVSAALLSVWQGFAIYSVPAIIGQPAKIRILSVEIVNLLSFSYPPDTDVAIALSVIVVFFVVAIWSLQKRVLRSSRFSTIGGKAQQSRPIRLGRWRGPIRLIVLSYLLFAAVLPIIALALVSLNGFWTPAINWRGLSLDTLVSSVFNEPFTRRALLNSLFLAAIGASIVMLAAALLSTVIARSRWRWHKAIDGAIKSPSVVSHVVVAAGILITFAGPPFGLGGTMTILLLAYVVIYLPQGSVVADAAAGQAGEELPAAARTCGASPFRVFRRIRLPLMLPGLMAGWALVFARMAGDLEASAILSGTSTQVVGRRVLEIYQNGSYAELASLTLVLVLLTGSVVTLALCATRRSGGRKTAR